MVLKTADLIGQTVIAHIHENIQIRATNGIMDLSFSLTGTKARAAAAQKIRIFHIARKLCKRRVFLHCVLAGLRQVSVYRLSKFTAALQRRDFQRSNRQNIFQIIILRHRLSVLRSVLFSSFITFCKIRVKKIG